ncbi:hypothetical protein D0860_08306 [Hortaea werneckii]|uniref:Tat pathway signal sequence n=1 Tax=Hortaea werneckii TaxID=91943 RepID=A0A3M7GE99_HORWE|nr:hypothetical protein D0860_08306 [Hortaea werneckii]
MSSYHPLYEDKTATVGEEELFTDESYQKRHRNISRFRWWLLVATNIVFAILCVLLYVDNFELRQPGQVQYVGRPAKQIDEAWERLLRGLEIVLDGPEAETIKGKTFEEPENKGWRLSMDMYHSLHCVNVVRRAIDFDHYSGDGLPSDTYRIHVDHCVDYLRQVVQCQGDLTPLAYHWNAELQTGFPEFGATHTCRNFEMIDEWALARTMYLGPEYRGGHQH